MHREPDPAGWHDRKNLSERIKAQALSLGFNKAGIVRASAVKETFLEEWLLNSYQAGMSWMHRTKEIRLDPEKYLPGVKSIVSLALNYYCPDEDRPSGTLQVSRYAAGRDYHAVLTEKLRILHDYIQVLIPGVRGKIAVDSAPVLDKVWAALAGIGWIGKHSNIITRELGSYLFLGEILLDYELYYDKPISDFCGTCSLCIDRCPTGAIVKPYVVDSNKCISYRTIEHKGDFPGDMQKGNEDWIFGCDVCQEVCPWNKFSRETCVSDLKPRDGMRFPRLQELESLSEEEFEEKFRDSPVKRCRFEGFKRNITHARENI
ncbi:tRNA epoxyqueuosine(34) reductase QueG [candidate division KSB1 bacterium]